jgi:hypothetical protein
MHANHSTFSVDQRVELHPSTDLWMRGARYGAVKAILPDGRLEVKLDRLTHIITCAARDLLPIQGT